ncbi:xylose ABC transporter ATP-binding protein [Clostridium paridis]|uniref:Xylose ABC transporter ATP-binding protein n=1 Tax=Clostridium paridis TaxID=2803863 RepID=A0A937FH82_9CLOT|nr:xylose ABC transporter ATP-binding protein [Clostridium paridis]MBL4931501.1 xylose ABC transporter ATP-binding protein [Clostridium paridis]
MDQYILEMNHITKEFPGVKALDDVCFKVKKGEIHALVGENGAGKSTLMKILSGVYPHNSYTGEILVKGNTQSFENIKDSEKVGIAIIYQELTLVKYLSIAENIFLGNEFNSNGIIDWDKTYMSAEKILKEVKLEDNPDTKVIELGIGKQQLIEIAKALSKNVEILILDEPTAALNETDSKNLLTILKELRSKGVTCIYISHKLEEVIDIADTVTIIRDGKTVCTNDMHNPAEKLTEDKIITHMVGRQLTQRFPRKEHTPGEVVLEIKNWTVYNPEIPDKEVINNVSMKARKGEILGIAGLMGSGRTEFIMSLIGAYGVNAVGEIFVEGKKVTIKNPRDAISNGISYLSEDRKGKGLILMMDIMNNTSISSLNGISHSGVINSNEEINATSSYVKALNIKTPSIEQKVENLSGGNQQKVAIAKWLMTNPKVLILDEPTRGIDVGAKFEIYNIMNQLVDKGVSVIMISSELPEILGMSDRIIVMNRGKFTGEIDWKEASQEKVMHYATGGK